MQCIDKIRMHAPMRLHVCLVLLLIVGSCAVQGAEDPKNKDQTGGGKGDGTGQKAGSGKETKPAPVERPKQEERPTTCSADFCKNGCVCVYAHCCTIVCTLPAISVSQTTSMNAQMFPGLTLTHASRTISCTLTIYAVSCAQ